MMPMNRLLFPAHLAMAVSLVGSSPLAAVAQTTQTVEVDPIRCWWRTSAGAVRTGEIFSLVLTCAVLENDAVQVVPDESKLAPSTIELTPFETVSGTHPEDLRTANRRFFQYDYRLRMINPDFIGRDVALPELTLHYRVNSRIAGNESLQGRDQMYVLPHHSVRVLAMVPSDAADIRDGADASFANVDNLRFRARVLEIVATTLIVLGALMVALLLVRLITHARRRRTADAAEHAIRLPAVLRLAARELSAVQREVDGQGWTEPLVGRALAAARVAGGAAVGRPPSQRLLTAAQDRDDGLGGLTYGGRRGRRRISSPVTARDLDIRLAALPDTASSHARELLSGVRSALATFTAAQYSPQTEPDRGALDRALSDVLDAVRRLRTRQISPSVQLRRWLGRPVDVA
jgi:hypothetical protein